MELLSPPSRQNNNTSPRIYNSQKVKDKKFIEIWQFKILQTIVDNEVKLTPKLSISKKHHLDVSSTIE